MDQQQQRRVNQAAEEFASAVKESYRAVSECGQSAYELNAQLTEQFFNRVVDNLRTQTDANREAGQALAEQAQRGAGGLPPARAGVGKRLHGLAELDVLLRPSGSAGG